MSNDLVVKSEITDKRVARYVAEKIVVETDIEKRLRAETAKLKYGRMISTSDVGAFLAILVQSIQAKNVIEVGTFTGYTAMKMALALPQDGKVVSCDISEEWASIGRPFWQEAKVTEKINLRLGNASETLKGLLDSQGEGSFDFAFIDADKANYEKYYELCLKLVRPGGLIVLDNMLWSGTVADPNNDDETAKILRSLNEKISIDSRVFSCLLTVGDGLMLARKK